MPLPEGKNNINNNETQEEEGVLNMDMLDAIDEAEPQAPQEAEQPQGPDYDLGEELIDDLPFLMQNVIKEEEGVNLFDMLAAKGCIRSIEGKKFTKVGPEGANEIAQEIRKGRKFVIYKTHDIDPSVKAGDEVRIGDITFNQTQKSIVYSSTTPDRGIDYSDLSQKEVEAPEASEELIAFARELKATLDGMKDFDWNKPSDLARFKVYYTDNNGGITEKNAFASWNLKSSGKDSYSVDTDEKIDMSPLYSDAERDMVDSDYSLDRFLESIEKNGADYYKISSNGKDLIHIYAMMQAAKEGRLMFTDPGDTPDKSHPIRLRENGKIEILPKESDASPEQLGDEGYAVGLKLAKSSPHAGDEAYAKELKDYRTKLFTAPLAVKDIANETKIHPFVETAVDAGYTKDSFLAEIREMRYVVGTDTVNNLNEAAEENGINAVFTEPKENVKQERQALSLRARQVYYEIHFVRHKVLADLRDAVGPDTYSEKEFNSVYGWDKRDGFPVLFEISDDPGAVDRNIRSMELYSGKIGLSSEKIAEIPEAELKDLKYQMFAQAFNNALGKLDSFDFESVKGLTDTQLVDRWTEIAPPLIKLSVVKRFLEGAPEIQKQIQDNPYVDRSLVKSILTKETRYINQYMILNNRMKAITCPEYVNTNLDEFEKLLYDDANYICEGMEDKGPETEYSFAKFAAVVNNGMHSAFSDEMEYQLRENNHLTYDAKIIFYNQEGKIIQGLSALDLMRNGAPVFAAAERNPESLSAFTLDKRTGNGVLNNAVLNDKRFNTLKTTLTTRIQSEKTAYENLEILQSRSPNKPRTFSESFTDIVGEALKKNHSKDQTRTQLKEFIRREPSLTLEQFRSIPGINGKNEPLPSREEVNRRRALSEKLIMDYFEDAWDRSKTRNETNVDAKLKTMKGLSGYMRQFKEVMFIHTDTAEDIAKNEADMNAFVDGDNETRKRLVEQRFREYKKYEPLFDHPMTDEHIAENYTQLRRVGVPMGMEFDSFMDALDKIGVDLGAELRKEMLEFNKKVYNYQNLVSFRAEIMMSQYYPYLSDPSFQDTLIAQSQKNPEVQRFGKDCLTAVMGFHTFKAQIFTEQVLGDKKEEYDSVLIDGKYFAAEDYGEYGNLIEAGKTITFLKKDSMESLSFDISSDDLRVKGTPSSKQMTKDQIIDHKFEAKKARIDATKKLKSHEKEMEKRVLDAQKELFRVLEDGPDARPSYNEEKKNCLLHILTEVTVSNMVSLKDLSTDIRKSFMSKETYQGTYHTLAGSTMIKEILENLPKDKDALEQLNGKDFFNRIVEAQKNYGKNYVKNHRTQEINNKLRKYPVYFASNEDLVKETLARDEKFSEVLKNSKDSAKLAHDRLSREFFGGKKLTADAINELCAKTQLRNLTLSRNSIQAIALSLMLTQGIPVESALSDNAEMVKIRHDMTVTAMKAIAANDMDFIRQNLAMGMKPLSDYVESKLNNLSAISSEEMLKPENSMLLSACQFLTEFNQELENVQKELPAEQKLTNPALENLRDKTQTLALQFETAMAGSIVYNANKFEKFDKVELETAMVGYLESAMNEAYQSYKKKYGVSLIPEKTAENEHPITNLMEQMYQVKVDAQADIRNFMNSEVMKNLSAEDVKKIFISMADNSFGKDMDLKLLENNDGTLTVASNLLKAVKKSVLRNSVELAKSAPQKSEIKKNVSGMVRQ